MKETKTNLSIEEMARIVSYYKNAGYSEEAIRYLIVHKY